MFSSYLRAVDFINRIFGLYLDTERGQDYN